jgi:DNA-binding transcriptional ArsR family regulator
VSFNERLERPTVETVLLLELTAALPLEAWVADGEHWRHELPANVELATVEGVEHWWVSEGFIQVDTDPFAAPVIGQVKFWFSDAARVVGDRYYDARLKSVPQLSLRIEPRFGGVAQIGGGQLALHATDGFFDGLMGVVRWDHGTAVLRMGLDVTGAPMEVSEYRTIGTWSLDGADLTDETLQVKVKERKMNLREKIPAATFTRAAYPYLANDRVGKVIPTIYGRVYGVMPTLIDPNLNRLKVCAHAVRGFIGLRKQEQRERTETYTLNWFPESNYWRTAFTGEVINVKCAGADVLKVDSPEAVAATVNTWHLRDNELLLHVAVVPTEANVTVYVKVSYQIWTEIPFATTDLAQGEFTVSREQWDGQADLAVDVIGKVVGGTTLENPADIVRDILASVGETEVDEGSFARARSYFDMGTDRYGNRRIVLRPALWLNESKEALEVLNQINELCGTCLYVNAEGRWVLQVSHPESGEGLPELAEAELLELEREEDAGKVYTACEVQYGKRHQEEWSERVTVENERLKRLAGKAVHGLRKIEAALWQRQDAEYLARRVLSTEGQPLVLYRAKVPRLGMVLAPGDKVVVRRERGGLREVCEVLEISWDLANRQVSLVLGNQRGWGGSCGFWVGDDFPAWDAGWTKDEARSRGAAAGFWTDANGFARSADGRSLNVSRWW